MRPTYENVKTLAAEKAVADAVMKKYPHFHVHKTKEFYACDAVILQKGRIVYVAEIKCRNIAHDTFSTYFISLHKMANCEILADYMEVPMVIIIGYTDGIWTLKDFKERHFEIGGRKDRNDKADIEPMVHFPIKNFKKL